jgi:HEPN domain-containing protein
MPKPVDAWMDYALADLRRGEILCRENDFSITCYFAQQASEKALKGFLVDNGMPHPHTHDLVKLNSLCRKIDNGFSNLNSKVALLNQFYMPVKYPDAPAGTAPGGAPSKDLAGEALDDARDVVNFCKKRIND